MYELKNGSERLVFSLMCVKDDERVIAQLAHALNYIPEQLQQDIQALNDRTDSYISRDAALGYAASGAISAKIYQTGRLVEGIQYAMENMTAEEAELTYTERDF